MKTTNAVLLAVAAVALLSLGALLGRRASSPAPEVTESVVLERVRQIAKLATIEHQIADIVTFEEPSPWPIFGKDKKALVIARGKVLAGFDLKKPIACRIWTSDAGTTVDLRLPTPEIIAVDPSYQYYDLQNLTKEQNEWLLERARLTMLAAARKAGVFEDAERSLAIFLSGLFPSVRFNLTFDGAPYKGPSSIAEWRPEPAPK